MAHTPGPYRITHGDGYRNIVPNDGHGSIAKIRARKTKEDCLAEMDANASLFHAAPELLEVCEAVAAYFAGTNAPLGNAARAAAAKARGAA
jgi:hypothetical protein